MKVEISYMFDASELGGQNLVTFEELYDLKNPEEPVKVAEHKDIDDEGQTVPDYGAKDFDSYHSNG